MFLENKLVDKLNKNNQIADSECVLGNGYDGIHILIKKI